MKETLSAFIDAELSEHEERQVVERLRTDVELRRTWERYHLIRAAVTRQLDALAPGGLADRVAGAIEGQEGRPRPRLRFWPLAGGFVAAASLAAMAILAAQTFIEAPTAAHTAAAPVLTASPTAPATTLASPGERLNVYLVGHNEFMPTAGMGGMLPYARVVTYDTNK
jgi:sigma-E factor negative regulatory protein RseA